MIVLVPQVPGPAKKDINISLISSNIFFQDEIIAGFGFVVRLLGPAPTTYFLKRSHCSSNAFC